MHVVCKQCKEPIAVTRRPEGSTNLSNVDLSGDVNAEGGKISFRRGGKITFRKGGMLGFGKPQSSTFTCSSCGHTADYSIDEILD